MKKFFFFAILFSPLNIFAYAYLLTPSSAVALSGTPGHSWNNPANALLEDGVTTSTAASTNILQLKGFNGTIPANATVTGIQVDIKEQGLSFVIDSSVILYNADGTSTSSNLSKGVDWPSLLGYVSYGGPSTTWGLTLTPNLVNSFNFGVGIAGAKDDVGSQTAIIDFAKITVYFTAPTTIYNGTIPNGTLR